MVSLSTHARDLHRADADQPPSQEHIEQIKALNRSDAMAQEKLQDRSGTYAALWRLQTGERQ